MQRILRTAKLCRAVTGRSTGFHPSISSLSSDDGPRAEAHEAMIAWKKPVEGMAGGGAFKLVHTPDPADVGVRNLMAAVDKAVPGELFRPPEIVSELPKKHEMSRLFERRFDAAIKLGPQHLNSMRIDWEGPGREAALDALSFLARRTYFRDVGVPVRANLANIVCGPRGVGKSAVLQAACIATYVAAKGGIAVGYYGNYPFVKCSAETARPTDRANFSTGVPLSAAQMIGETLIANGFGGGHTGIHSQETLVSVPRQAEWAAWNTDGVRMQVRSVAMPVPVFMVVDEIQDLFRYTPTRVAGYWSADASHVNNLASEVFEVLTSAFDQGFFQPSLGLTLAGSSPIVMDAVCYGEFRSEYCKERYGKYITLPHPHPHMIVKLGLKPLGGLHEVKRFINAAVPGALEEALQKTIGDFNSEDEVAALSQVALLSKGFQRFVVLCVEAMRSGNPPKPFQPHTITGDASEWGAIELALATHYVRNGLVSMPSKEGLLDQSAMGVTWEEFERSVRLMIEYNVMKDRAEAVLEKVLLGHGREEYFKMWEEVGLLVAGETVHFATRVDFVEGISKLFTSAVDLRLPSTMLEPQGARAGHWGNILAASALGHETNFARAVEQYLEFREVAEGGEMVRGVDKHGRNQERADEWKAAIGNALRSMDKKDGEVDEAGPRGLKMLNHSVTNSAKRAAHPAERVPSLPMEFTAGTIQPLSFFPDHWCAPKPDKGIDLVIPVGDYVVCVQVKLSMVDTLEPPASGTIGVGFGRGLAIGGIDPEKALLVLVTTHKMGASSTPGTIVKACRKEYGRQTKTESNAGMPFILLGREQMAELWHPLVQELANALQLETYLGKAGNAGGRGNAGGTGEKAAVGDKSQRKLASESASPIFAPLLDPSVKLAEEVKQEKALALARADREKEEVAYERALALAKADREKEEVAYEKALALARADREKEEVKQERALAKRRAQHELMMAVGRLPEEAQAEVKQSGLSIEDVGGKMWKKLASRMASKLNDIMWEATLEDVAKVAKEWNERKGARDGEGKPKK